MIYNYTKPNVNVATLSDECLAAGLPVTLVSASGSAVQITTSRDLTPAEKTTLDTVVANHGGIRRARPLWKIRGDIQALTTAQFNNVWADLSAAVSGGPPRKYLGDYGVNAGTIFAYDHIIFVVQGTTAQVKAGQISLTACYCQDNPSYLIHPPFDTSINIDGTEPAT